jgi:Helix-turn-helix
MGYRGKVKEQAKARRLRAQNRTLADIAKALGVSKSSVSLWVRDVPFTPSLQLGGIHGPHRRPHPAHEAKLRQIEELNRAGAQQIGTLSDREFLVAGVALYAGEGGKGDGAVQFSNTDPAMIRFFCAWLRRFFGVDESRLRARVYLHEGLDLEAAETFWSALTDVPREQFRQAHRAVPDVGIRHNKHEYGCAYVYYCCSKTHRQIMGLNRALLSSDAIPG